MLRQKRESSFIGIFRVEKAKIFFLCLLLGSSISLWSKQTNSFMVIHDGEDIGKLIVTEEKKQEGYAYTYVMDITTRFLFKEIRVEYNMDALFKKGVLDNYHLIYKLNNRLMDDVSLNWTGSKYIIKTAKEEKEHLSKIYHSMILMFCRKPDNKTKVWGELICDYSKLVKEEENVFKVKFSDGKENKYIYENNQLVKASIQTKFIDFDMIRVKE
jgi:hypothetical protein